jgi:pimeloyl-ACP methyl ester carboxylesterase
LSEPATHTVDINGQPCRIWTKGTGPKLGFLAGYGGLPRWIPMLERLAEKRTVIVPSLPGHPGATGHALLDSHLDWLVAVRQLVLAAGLDGCDLAGGSVGGSFVAELAALWPQSVRKVAMIAPWGLYDDAEPPTDVWCQKPAEIAPLLCVDDKIWTDLKAVPAGANSVEWPIEQIRASEAAARVFWPLGNTHLATRLPMIVAPTLLLWGDQDRVMPRSYADRIARTIKGPCTVKIIADAGHLAELDQPDAVAQAVLTFLA